MLWRFPAAEESDSYFGPGRSHEAFWQDGLTPGIRFLPPARTHTADVNPRPSSRDVRIDRADLCPGLQSDLVPVGPSVVSFIHTDLEAESLPPDRLGALDSRSIALAKTERRTALGYLNEMARFCEYAVGDAGGLARCDAWDLNHELRREWHLSRQPPGYIVPIERAGGSRNRPPLRIVH